MFYSSDLDVEFSVEQQENTTTGFWPPNSFYGYQLWSGVRTNFTHQDESWCPNIISEGQIAFSCFRVVLWFLIIRERDSKRARTSGFDTFNTSAFTNFILGGEESFSHQLKVSFERRGEEVRILMFCCSDVERDVMITGHQDLTPSTLLHWQTLFLAEKNHSHINSKLVLREGVRR